MPYLNVATHIPGRAYDNLLGEMGGTGYPTLMFLNAEGKKLLEYQGSRDVGGFEKALEAVQVFQSLVAKAEKGDEKAATEVLISQLKMKWFDFEEAKRRIGALSKVSTAQQRVLEQLLVDTEVRSMAEKSRENGRVKTGLYFANMLAEGRVPAEEAELYSYWSLMAEHAVQVKDKRLFGKIVKEFKQTLPGERYRRVLKDLEERLKNF